MATFPMIAPNLATQVGLLPVRDKPVRFAVGAPDGITSNSWKIWAKKSGAYIACRDNFKETKVSLHTSSDPPRPRPVADGLHHRILAKDRSFAISR